MAPAPVRVRGLMEVGGVCSVVAHCDRPESLACVDFLAGQSGSVLKMILAEPSVTSLIGMDVNDINCSSAWKVCVHG